MIFHVKNTYSLHRYISVAGGRINSLHAVKYISIFKRSGYLKAYLQAV